MTVVVGFVDTPEGRAALSAAAHEAVSHERRLVVVLAAPRGGPGPDLDEAAERVRAELDESGVRHEIRHTARSGDAAEDIVQVAREEDASLVVIGLRRRSAVGRLFLGAKAQRILLDAPCPVLAIKTDSD
ncbi:MAG: universal stress protein [Actinomycetales bacterium]|nr:universal stress protein [Actinomycetales bacterium]